MAPMDLAPRAQPYLRTTPEGLALLAVRTPASPVPQFPPPEFVVGGDTFEEVALGPLGTLYTYSTVHLRDQAPYTLAMVDFAPGVRVFGRMLHTPGEAPELDTPVRVVPHALPDGSADYAFAPVAQGARHG